MPSPSNIKIDDSTYSSRNVKHASKIQQLTTTATPVSQNLGMQISLTICPSDPAHGRL